MLKAVIICILLFAGTLSAKDMAQIELLSVQASQLQQLEYKVSGRNDVKREQVSAGLHRYLISGRFEAYYFTTAEHPAHPIAIFRGKVTREDGSTGFDQRAWSASLDEAAVRQLIKALESRGFNKL